MTKAAVRSLAAAGILITASCAAPPARLSTLPDPQRVRAQLLEDESSTRTVRGLAHLEFAGAQGRGSASQVVVVALPDRARLETLTPLGTTALLATLRGGELRVHAPWRREYGVGRATRDTLGQLVGVPVPPELLLRLLAGLPPLPLRAEDPRLTVVGDGEAVRVESVDGEYWQRLWTGVDEAGLARGEAGRASEVLFAFTFADRRSTNGREFPFALHIQGPAARSQLRLRYERVQLNMSVDADLFDLPSPTDPETRIIDLGGP